MCWVGRNVLAVASATKEGVELSHQLTLIHVKNTPPQKSNLGSLNAGSSLAWTIQALEQKPHDMSKGAIMCMSAMTEDASGLSLATAGMDKQIVCTRLAVYFYALYFRARTCLFSYYHCLFSLKLVPLEVYSAEL